MPKAVISNRIYIDNPGVEHTKKVIAELTYKIKKDTGSKKFASIETIRNYKTLIKGILSIPQGRSDLIPESYEIVDKRVLNPVPFPDPKFPLRADQQEVYDQVNDTCFINALVGWGKTFTALHIARKLGQKTLVITHTTALRDQWVEEIELLFGCKPGVIGSGQFDHEDHFVTVANVQTLVKRTTELAKEFGTVILDEAHHCPATTFAQLVDSFHARYRIALSGTMIRKDQKHVVFRDYFGSHILRPAAANTMTPTVHAVKSGIILKPDATWVEKINELTQDEFYQQYIANIAQLQINEGHSVLIVADRVEFLQKVQENIGETCLLVTGETSFEERQKAKQQLLSGEKRAVAGSRQIFSEGISINVLSCIILAVPISNDSLLEQLAGRIQRQYENKLTPVIVDIQFAGRSDRKQNNDRLGFYLRKGWQVIAM
jgi:superfamily II DNA or RNA helicase